MSIDRKQCVRRHLYNLGHNREERDQEVESWRDLQRADTAGTGATNTSTVKGETNTEMEEDTGTVGKSHK